MIFQRLNNRIVCVFLVLVSFYNNANANSTELNDLEKVMGIYKGSETIILDVKKTVKSEVLEKENVYRGIIRFSKGKINCANEEPEKSTMIYDGEVLWTIQYPPKEFNSPPQIVKTNLKKSKNTPLVLNSIFGSKPLKSYFEIIPDKVDGNLKNYILKDKKQSLGIKEILIAVDVKEEKIISLAYKDDVDNSTRLEFKSTRFNEKIKGSTFSYKPPKNSVITEY
jgi:outer membrane lipoprotein-sorting protein